MAALPFRRVAVVGVGLIGGSIGLAIRRRARGARVVGIDRPAVLRRARARGAVHEGTAALARGLRGCDLVVLALPVDGIIRILPRVALHAAPDAVITDVGSTKGTIAAAARRAGLRGRFVGGHPMAGSERSGVDHALADLFLDAPWILCPEEASDAARARLRAFVRRLGARPHTLTPACHDEVVARLSHLPQIASVAIVNSAARGEARGALHLAGPAFRQMTRLAGSPPRLWQGILRTNRAAVRRALDDFGRQIRILRGALAGGAGREFRRAARARAALARRPTHTGS